MESQKYVQIMKMDNYSVVIINTFITDDKL